MLLEKESSCLLVIDIQEKLTPWVRNSAQLVERCQWLIRLAKELAVPQLLSEQYPKGLGETVEPLKTLLAQEAISKVHFSSFCEPAFKKQLLALNKKQLVLIGIEAHVCVLQTALDLQRSGHEVFVVVDAISSRAELDYHYALKRMKQAGIQLLTSEMVFFEWIRQAGTPEFKALSKAFLQAN